MATQPPSDLVTLKVAPDKTIYVGPPNMLGAPTDPKGPGQLFTIDAAEATRLKGLGVAVDPDSADLASGGI